MRRRRAAANHSLRLVRCIQSLWVATWLATSPHVIVADASLPASHSHVMQAQSGNQSAETRGSDAPFLINVGLPRTGTSTFAETCAAIGMPALHVCSMKRPQNAACKDGLLHGTAHRVLPPCKGGSHPLALTDTPFYVLDVNDMQTIKSYYPNARFVCTTRDVHSWVRSITRNQPNAGDTHTLRWMPKECLASRSCMQPMGPPWRNTTVHLDALQSIFWSHWNQSCSHVAQLNFVESTGHKVWHTLCNALSATAPREACFQLAASLKYVIPKTYQARSFVRSHAAKCWENGTMSTHNAYADELQAGQTREPRTGAH